MIKQFFLILLASTVSQADDLSRLAHYLQGSFSNRLQAAEDTAFAEIHLHMTRIWPDRTDTLWFYVEQAWAEQLDAPYRQRIYRITRQDSFLVSEVMTIDGAEEFIGAWRQPERFADVSQERLHAREGCAVYLTALPDGSFFGRTRERECLSNRRGAVYMTTEVRITKKQFISWDRGFDEAGRQVWGPIKSGYVFDKTEDEP
ncbi:MAG: chromophore lyase CpcT/CpeT [candidate division KSB1 bacterium]|nr:chromophore lyase CpcT/CpeT [candidate division KSB1 bacterium]